MDVVGVVLAAGAGRRAGGPKALRRDAAGVGWVERAVVRLEAAGCGSVLVVLGAEAEEARRLVPEPPASSSRRSGRGTLGVAARGTARPRTATPPW